MKLHCLHLLWVVPGGLVLTLGGCAPKPKSPPAAEKPPTAPPAPEPAVSPFKKPDAVRGVYLTAWSAGSTRKMDNVLAMLDRTELNAVVIDVRDAGQNYWKEMKVPMNVESGAMTPAIVNGKKVMDRLLQHGVYPIARIACFRDKYVPKKYPELGVQHSSGGVWKDRAGYMWLDPYNRKNWEYIGQIVDFALDQGFPEIQLDYVRFPSEGKASTQVFPAKKAYPDANAKPQDVVAAFAKFIGERVRKRKAVFSADLFGIISSSKSDQGIGQELEKVAEPFDLLCPMVYPSHFAKGEYGVKDPSSSPYLIILKSLADFKTRLPDKSVRPWLQDFFGYNAEQVRAQIKASKELGYEEYLLWNAQNKYTEAAVKDTSMYKPKPAPTAAPAPAPAPAAGEPKGGG